LSGIESHVSALLEICDEVEIEDPIEVFGPQIVLDLGEGSSIHDDEPTVEVPGVVPTVKIEEGDSFVKIIISAEEMKKDQAEGTGTEPVPEDVILKREGQAVGTGEPVLDLDRSGEEPDLMDVDSAVRTGKVPVREILKTGIGAVSVSKEAGERTGGEPVLEEAVGESRSALDPKHPAETPSGDEPRKKRVKTLAGRTDLPWVRKLKDLKAKTSSSSQKSPPKQPSQPTRKSYRLAAQGIRSSSINQGPPVIEEIPSSSEGSPAPTPAPATEPLESHVLGSEQASTENSPHQTPALKPVLKRKAEEQPSPATKSPAKPSGKRVKTAMAPSPKLEKFQKRGVVRGKLVKVSYFQEQGLEVFLDQLKAQGWYELFTNTQMGCSQPDVAEFYANVALVGNVLTSTVNGVLIEVNAQALGVILGVPATGFDLYVREDKSLVSKARLLELAQHLSQ